MTMEWRRRWCFYVEVTMEMYGGCPWCVELVVDEEMVMGCVNVRMKITVVVVVDPRQ
ncbi:hypothetical protein TIFTF001_032592 [Ficus carica]|uniref:Uncharacterized protein n=1 Tax=Ficus carica TaxID=3494 RepID=A0AA88E3Q2_FICCA|nr:hypothetical protein TIFTF001_032592 [Ficus carica]